MHAAPPPRRAPRTFVTFCTALLLVLAAAAVMYVHKELEPRRVQSVAVAPATFEVHTIPSSAELLLDGRRVGVGHYKGSLPTDGAQHELLAAADGFRAHLVMFDAQPPPRLIELSRVVPATLPSVPADERMTAAAAAAPQPAARSVRPPTRAGVALAAAARAKPTVKPRVQARVQAPDVRAAAKVELPQTVTASAPELAGDERSAAPSGALAGALDDVVATPDVAATAMAPKVRIIDDSAPQVRLVE